MEPNYQSGDSIIVDRTRYTFGTPQRGDVIGLKFPGSPDKRKMIKRIIALPGEHIKINGDIIYINDKKFDEPYLPKETFQDDQQDVVLGKDEYYVMGDNRAVSADSRQWGVVPRNKIVGRALIRIWPLSSIGFVENTNPIDSLNKTTY